MHRHLLSTSLALVVSAIAVLGCHGKAANTGASPAEQPTGTQPGASEAAPMPEIPETEAPPANGATYMDPTYGFRIGYPRGFVVKPQDASKLARFKPTPLASVFFMNPTMAAGSLAGVEPPDLEARVYRAEGADSLKNWLTSTGLASAESVDAARPFRNSSVSGLQVCASTMIAPGCSTFVFHGDRVYQLTPISREGEAMIETFALTQ
jgi:hypothetical protein